MSREKDTTGGLGKSRVILGRYRIKQRLGSGAFGVVFLATDTLLKREVCIKILRREMLKELKLEEARSRFLHEAQASARLKHPNIVTLHDVAEYKGRFALIMEYIEGKTLTDYLSGRKGLSAEEAASIIRQVVKALKYAHLQGVIHRDIKPGNIFLTPEGVVKLGDFGVAHVEGKAGLTASGGIIGTPGYISPEQLRGFPVDERSDLFSVGCLFYWMLVGEAPFDDEVFVKAVLKVLEEEPEPLSRIAPSTPVEVQNIVSRSLQKDPTKRYQNAEELLADLSHYLGASFATDTRPSVSGAAVTLITTPKTQERTRTRRWIPIAAGFALLAIASVFYIFYARRTNEIRSLAVLPFQNIGGDPEMEYLSDGITESTINNISRLPGLRVMARGTVFNYKGKNIDPRKVGNELKVDAVVSGSISQHKDTLVIRTDLAKTSDGSQIWGEQYTRRMADILDVQTEITLHISEQLKLNLSNEERANVEQLSTKNNDAYQLYLKGRFYWNKRTEEGFRKGIEYFSQAIEKDPDYALAWSGLADSHALLEDYGFVSAEEALPMARAAANKAVELDERLAEANVSLANVRGIQRDWTGAQKNYLRAIELSPNYATAHQWYAWNLIYMGDLTDAMVRMKHAQSLDPLSLIIMENIAEILYFSREYDHAILQLKRVLEMDPAFYPALLSMGHNCLALNRFPEALDYYQKVDETTGIAMVYAKSDRVPQAKQLLAELIQKAGHDHVSSFQIASAYAALHEKDQAFSWLQKACDEYDSYTPLVRYEPVWDSLREDPRYQDIFQCLNLRN